MFKRNSCSVPDTTSALAIFLPGGASVFPGACSPPFLIGSSLFSYEDVHSAVHSGVMPQFCATSVAPGVSARIMLTACWFGTSVDASGAFFLARHLSVV